MADIALPESTLNSKQMAQALEFYLQIGYMTYLNCPATCTTSNIIYTMKYPCGDYDYVDSTSGTLADAMAYHREYGNHIMHEALTGSLLLQASDFFHNSQNIPKAIINDQLVAAMQLNAADTDRVDQHLDFVPKPPEGYSSSRPQIQKQRLFFQQFVTASVQKLPYDVIDLYRMAIIAILPDDQSKILRYIVETLFIIHGESKLNMICPVVTNVEQRYGGSYKVDW
ncbi:unnamed protein product [Rotaria sordida]|uniref:Uncharacterized protein n=1 Tax=Rotaria sordida TaxID=392033 RepID=A0A819QL81_9BILA|nr:unnamed protein product [Rotaria sordida]